LRQLGLTTNVLDWTGSGEYQDGPKAWPQSLASGHVELNEPNLLISSQNTTLMVIAHKFNN